ncbi:MAG TPA: hypothetical protein VHC72_09835 [Bryobacteraceae bacterium]|nr:hypothetical protein [Bryobacteraceae bacterium]
MPGQEWIPSHNEWVELDLNGNLIRRVPIDGSPGCGLAFTADGSGMERRRPLVFSPANETDPVTLEWFDQPATLTARVLPPRL